MANSEGKKLVRVADYVASFIAAQGVEKVFMIVGGLSMHLCDAIAMNKNLKYVCNHHEQACVMAAEGYARETGKMGVACVTAGPGITNTLTGVVSAHFDSSPVMVIAGQTKASVVKAPGIRQFGVQGFETLPIFKPVTKYAVMVEDPLSIRFHLEKAAYLAKSGHPGVVWIEVPLDVQAKLIDPTKLEGFTPEKDDLGAFELEKKMPRFIELLKNSKRPLLLIGNGVRLTKSGSTAIKIAEKLGIPVITSRLGIDLVESSHPLFIGRPGTYGDRPANFAVQGCDLLIDVGCRLSMSLTGYDYQNFASRAKKVIVDIDEFELSKPSLEGSELPIRCDVLLFLEKFEKESGKLDWQPRKEWLSRCQHWKKTYPVVLPEYSDDSKGINTYYFTGRLSEMLSQGDTIVVDTSSCFHIVSQAIKMKKGQKYVTTGGLSPMGYALPAAIGVAAAKKTGQTIGIVGDGSLQMNIQEFQTIVHYKLPVKLFVWMNNGYLLIRHTQNNFQEGHLVGESPATGMSCPSTEKIAAAYGLKFFRASKISELDAAIRQTLEYDGPAVCEIICPEKQLVQPRVSSEKLADGTMVSKPFDDMFPFLDRAVYARETANRED